MLLLYKIKLLISLLKNDLYTKNRYNNMQEYIYKNGIKYFKNNYENLLDIFKDLDQNIIIQGENYLIGENYLKKYICMDYRMRLGMFIRQKYIYSKEKFDETIMTQDAENISFDILIGYNFYLNKSFQIFKKAKIPLRLTGLFTLRR